MRALNAADIQAFLLCLLIKTVLKVLIEALFGGGKEIKRHGYLAHAGA
jgi:hypothetical protein